MTGGGGAALERRVERVAEGALADKRYVTAIDVLVGLGWLPARLVDEWRQGRVEYLERVTQANLSKISSAMSHFRRWARSRDLQPSEASYVARTRDRRPLRFSKTGAADIERAYRTHWVSPELSERKRERLAARVSQPPELVVVWPLNDWTCARCDGTGDLLIMDEPGPLCMPCAGLDHLTFLPSGDAQLTRRAKRTSRQSAVVVRFSRSRKRYERKGILVEEAAIDKARAQGCGRSSGARELRTLGLEMDRSQLERAREAGTRAAAGLGELREGDRAAEPGGGGKPPVGGDEGDAEMLGRGDVGRVIARQVRPSSHIRSRRGPVLTVMIAARASRRMARRAVFRSRPWRPGHGVGMATPVDEPALLSLGPARLIPRPG